MRKKWLETIYRLAKTDERIVFIGSDLTNDAKMAEFRKEIPTRFFMEGISEAHLAGMAAGMAMTGKIVFLNTIATFLTRRAFEQNVVDIGLTNANVRLIGNGGGLVYAPLGPTHLAIEDFAIMSAIPNMAVVACADAAEMEKAIEASIDHKGPIYFRVGKGGEAKLPKSENTFVVGKTVRHGGDADVLIVSTGVMTATALAASDALGQAGVRAAVLHVPRSSPLMARLSAKRCCRVPVSLRSRSMFRKEAWGALSGN